MNLTPGLQFLTQRDRQRIVHGVLKSLNLSPQRADYDDLVQEASLIFAQAYAAYPGDQTDPANERDLMCFAFQRMRWRILDLLRKQQRAQLLMPTSLDTTTTETDYQELLADPQANRAFQQLEHSDFFTTLFNRCNHNQQRYLIAKLKYDYRDHEIAQIYGISRQAVYQWKQGVIKQAQQLDDHS